MSYTNIMHLGNAHQEWLRALDFYATEVEILKKRLLEIASKNTSKESGAEIEHFQNQFIIQRNNIDELKHSINEHNHKVSEVAKNHAGHIEESYIEEHHKIEEEVREFEKVVNDIRREFNIFLARLF